MEIKERDWKVFRKKLPGWQEDYMEKLIAEYIAILSDSSKNASSRFWELEKRIKLNRRDTGVLCDMRRSRMVSNILSLLCENAIALSDLDEFSDDFKQRIAYLYED